MNSASRPKVLVIDDAIGIIEFLDGVLGAEYELSFATAGGEGIELASRYATDLILLDVMMPDMDGFEVCRRLRQNWLTRDIPVVFLTSLASPAEEELALTLGADDFIPKPISPPVLRARVRNHLQLSRSKRALERQNEQLEYIVAERTREVGLRDQKLIAAQTAIITAFCSLAEARDNETGNHIRRTQNYVKALAEELRDHPRFCRFLSDEMILLLYKCAPLHDVGKVAIPDSVLLKPGKLTPEEWIVMKRHCGAGYYAIDMAANEFGEVDNSFFRHAAEIAQSHHERWDGTGYPGGIAGDAIPISARLMAVADVYDALISKRVYKAAFPHDQALQLIVDDRGKHFDPDVVNALLSVSGQFSVIAQQFGDDDSGS